MSTLAILLVHIYAVGLVASGRHALRSLDGGRALPYAPLSTLVPLAAAVAAWPLVLAVLAWSRLVVALLSLRLGWGPEVTR